MHLEVHFRCCPPRQMPRRHHRRRGHFPKALLPKTDHTQGKIAGQTYKSRAHELKLDVPENWRLGFFHPQSLISFHTEDQEGQGRLQVTAISSMTKTAESLAYQFAKKNGLKFLQGREVLYRAGYGYLGRFLGISPRGRPMEYRLFVTIRRERGYILLCGAPPEKLESYILDMERIMRGLQFS